MCKNGTETSRAASSAVSRLFAVPITKTLLKAAMFFWKKLKLPCGEYLDKRIAITNERKTIWPLRLSRIATLPALGVLLSESDCEPAGDNWFANFSKVDEGICPLRFMTLNYFVLQIVAVLIAIVSTFGISKFQLHLLEYKIRPYFLCYPPIWLILLLLLLM